jgi:hypothetical protein
LFGNVSPSRFPLGPQLGPVYTLDHHCQSFPVRPVLALHCRSMCLLYGFDGSLVNRHGDHFNAALRQLAGL